MASASVLSCSRPWRSRSSSPPNLAGSCRGADGHCPAQRSSGPVGRARPSARADAIEPPGQIAFEPLLGLGRKRLGVGPAEKLFQPLGDVDEPGLVDDQLTGQVHQVVEPVALDADRLGDLRLLRLAASLLTARRCGGRGRRRGPAAVQDDGGARPTLGRHRIAGGAPPRGRLARSGRQGVGFWSDACLDSSTRD